MRNVLFNIKSVINLFQSCCRQCCAAETICFRSGSGFQKFSAPALATALELPVITDIMLKSTFFMFLMKENQYEFRLFLNTLADPEPGAGAET